VFEFLHTLAPGLLRHYDLAYRYCHEDPENSLVKLRACAMIFVELFYAHYELYENERERESLTLYDKINNPQIRHLLPFHVREKLNYLRIMGNKGAHPGSSFRSHKAALEAALAALQTTHKIAQWLYEILYPAAAAPVPDYVPPLSTESDRLYGDAILRGDAEARYAVGMIFLQRAELAQEAELQQEAWQDAVYWLAKAAQQRHPAALYQLGMRYLHGQGVAQDFAQAVEKITAAAQLQQADAQFELGHFLFQGSLHGLHPHPQDHAQAFEYFMKAAQQEHLGALNRLVQMYYEGLGVAPDVDEAFYYAQKAALAGYPSAQFKLAHLYQTGLGVEKNPAEALRWYREAAQGGYADAQIVMFKYYSNGLEIAKDLAQALDWLRLAEAQGHPGAAYYLGLAYKRGIGVEVDLVRALNLLKRCLDTDTEQQYAAAQWEFAQGITQLRQMALQAAQNKDLPPFRKHAIPLENEKIGRNDPCPCGSGKKYKKCCMQQHR